MDGPTARAAAAKAEAAIDAAGGESKYDMFYDEPADTPYESYDPTDPAGGANEIMVVNATGAMARITEISPMTQALNRELMFRRIHVKAEWKEVVDRAINE